MNLGLSSTAAYHARTGSNASHGGVRLGVHEWKRGRCTPGWKTSRQCTGARPSGGDTEVRRSVGRTPDRTVLYIGLSNFTTARAMGVGMEHVGASVVAELDIHGSYPIRLTTRSASSGPRHGTSSR
jgi:hypothetical protein